MSELMRQMEAQIIYHESTAKELRETIARLKSIASSIEMQDWGGVPASVQIATGQFRGKRVSVAIRDYLIAKGKPASEEELEKALQTGTCERFIKAGKKGSIKKAINQSPKYLELVNGLVQLKTE